MKVAIAAVVLLLMVSSAVAEITNSKASLVLDGGSYLVTLVRNRDEMRLLIMNPSRRPRPKDTIWLLGEKDQAKALIPCDSEAGKRLHADLQAAAKSTRLDSESKTISAMLDRILLQPDLPWSDVRFQEKWE